MSLFKLGVLRESSLVNGDSLTPDLNTGCFVLKETWVLIMNTVVEFELDVLPKSLNSKLRTNRFKLHSENKKFDFIIANILHNVIPLEPYKKAHISVIRYSYRMLDFDGLVGSLKPVIDAIVSCGLIVDDSWKVLGPWSVDQKFRPKSQGSILKFTITLFDSQDS